VAERIAALDLSPALAFELAPLVAVLRPLSAEIAAADPRVTHLGATDPAVALLATIPGVGPLTASALVATVDDVARFRSAHQLEAYLGVVPGEKSSGEKRRVGRIKKAGNARARWLLVEARGASSARSPARRARIRDVAGPGAVRRDQDPPAARARHLGRVARTARDSMTAQHRDVWIGSGECVAAYGRSTRAES
jgi:transposase